MVFSWLDMASVPMGNIEFAGAGNATAASGDGTIDAQVTGCMDARTVEACGKILVVGLRCRVWCRRL